MSKIIPFPVQDTVGAKSLELMQKAPETRDPIELEREMHKGYEENVWDCVDEHKKVFKGDFYVVVITKKEPILKNIMRHYFLGRTSCPTPDYDQCVYIYKREEDELYFMWVVPSKDTCKLLKDNAAQVAPEEAQLLKYVLDFYDGTLLKVAKSLNGEEAHSVRLEKQ